MGNDHHCEAEEPAMLGYDRETLRFVEDRRAKLIADAERARRRRVFRRRQRRDGR
jgi:hypothetical protein